MGVGWSAAAVFNPAVRHEARERLHNNPEFTSGWMEVVIEPSPDTPTGLVVFDDWGRWISVDPANLRHL